MQVAINFDDQRTSWQKKSTMKRSMGCWRRNLKPPSCRLRNADQSFCSASVCGLAQFTGTLKDGRVDAVKSFVRHDGVPQCAIPSLQPFPSGAQAVPTGEGAKVRNVVGASGPLAQRERVRVRESLRLQQPYLFDVILSCSIAFRRRLAAFAAGGLAPGQQQVVPVMYLGKQMAIDFAHTIACRCAIRHTILKIVLRRDFADSLRCHGSAAIRSQESETRIQKPATRTRDERRGRRPRETRSSRPCSRESTRGAPPNQRRPASFQ